VKITSITKYVDERTDRYEAVEVTLEDFRSVTFGLSVEYEANWVEEGTGPHALRDVLQGWSNYGPWFGVEDHPCEAALMFAQEKITGQDYDGAEIYGERYTSLEWDEEQHINVKPWGPRAKELELDEEEEDTENDKPDKARELEEDEEDV